MRFLPVISAFLLRHNPIFWVNIDAGHCPAFLYLNRGGGAMDLPVEISDLKKHLNIDINDDDDLLLEYEAAAVELAEHFMCREIIQRKDPQALAASADDVPAAVKQYIRCQVGDFYKQREITATGQFATFYKHLLDPYCLKYRDDEEN